MTQQPAVEQNSKSQVPSINSEAVTAPNTRHNRMIRLPFTREQHELSIDDAVAFRKFLEFFYSDYPELFPGSFSKGYVMKDIRISSKLGIRFRRITTTCDNITYTVQPSFVMPHCAGLTAEVSNGIFLRKFSVPYWAVAHVMGRNAMYWYRLETSLGSFSIVQTTVKDRDKLPEHIAADEKHSRCCGEKIYIGTTVGEGCILGCEVAENAGNEALENAYSVFKEEALEVDEEYSPKTVNLDGWAATNNAWQNLFPSVTIISCILHIYLKLRDCSKIKWRDAFDLVADKFWDCYEATNKRSFSQRVRRFAEWAVTADIPDYMCSKIEKMRKNCSSYSVAYDHDGSHRTSNMLDRLMQRMDRHIFASQYFHGTTQAANLAMRGWALIFNFAPMNPYTVKNTPGLESPAARINQKTYHDDWLQNLLVSTSLVKRYKKPPPNPL